METKINMKLSAIAALVGGNLCGADGNINGLSVPEFQREGTLCFIMSKHNLDYMKKGNAAAYIMPVGLECETDKPVVFVADTRVSLVKILTAMFPPEPVVHLVSKFAVVAETIKMGNPVSIGHFVTVDSFCNIGSNTRIGNNTVIGEHVSIGKNCIIYPNVTIYDNVTIGDNVIIHSGVVIGADGFGFVPGQNPIKIPQKGTVIIEDFVELGANTCVDRATIGATVIGFGTKIDDLVMVGHNTRIGKACLIASQVGFSGSIEIGDGVIAGGQVGFADHIKVAAGSMFGGKSGIHNDIKIKGTYLGSPCMDMIKYAKSYAVFQELPELRRRVKNLEKQDN